MLVITGAPSEVVPARGLAKAVGALVLVCSLLMALVALLFGFIVLEMAEDENCETAEECSQDVEVLFETVAIGLGVLGTAAGVKLLRGRRWAWKSVLAVFAVWAIVTMHWSVLLAASPRGSSASGIVVGGAVVGAVVTVVVLAIRLPKHPR